MKSKIPLEKAARQPFTILARFSEFGRSSIVFKCPFCGANNQAFIWSFAGSGKRCHTCRAIAIYQTGECYQDVAPAGAGTGGAK